MESIKNVFKYSFRKIITSCFRLFFVVKRGIFKYFIWGRNGNAPNDVLSILNTASLSPLFGQFGKGSLIHWSIHIEEPKNLFIGKNVRLRRGCDMTGMGRIIIEDNVLIGPRVKFYTNRHIYSDRSKPIMVAGKYSGLYKD